MSTTEYTPTEDEIKEAKDFLLERLDAEHSMATNLKRIMEKAAEQIVAIAYKYNIPPENFSFSFNPNLQREVDEVISGLVEEIIEDTDLLATYQAEEHEDEVLAFIHRETHGNTLDGRVTEYADKYKRELGIGIIAALLLGKSRTEATSAIRENLSSPFKNPFIVEVLKNGAIIEIPNYGRGHSNSMLNSLTKLTGHAIAEGWMHLLFLLAVDGGAVGFVTFRGSTYPCNVCDEYAGVVHPLEDPMPPLHLNCVCGAVFVYL